MKFMRNPRFSSLLKWVSQLSLGTHSKPFISATQNPRFFATQIEVLSKKSNVKRIRITRATRKMVEEAVLDYFYHTRGLHYNVAESISKNSPTFIENLLKEVDCVVASEISQTVTRYLRVHPIDEFEPFLESSGLKPSEYTHLLPRDKMFLNGENGLFMQNHHVLCYSGIDPKKIGKIFVEASEVFEYETEVLALKIEAYKDLGFSRSVLSKLIVCSPSILVGDVNVDLPKVLEMLKSMGCDLDWVMNNLSEEGSYDWSSVYRVLNLLREIYVDEDALCRLIKKHPRLIFEDSGQWTLILAGFGTKLGLSRNEICLLFQNLPQSQVEKCVLNLRHCFLFLKDIKMEDDEIHKIFRCHSWWLGSCSLMKTRTLVENLKAGRRLLRQVVQENPEEMKKWTLRSKIQPLGGSRDFTKWKRTKIQFLIDLGYKENSKEMEIAFQSFDGNVSDLRERFNLLVSLGFSEEDVKAMVKACPNILNQLSDCLKAKVNYYVNELGYPLSSLVAFPRLLRRNLQHAKFKFAMYSWLQARGKAVPNLAISSIVCLSDEKFVRRYVNSHPDGPKHWEDLMGTSNGLKPTKYSHMVPSDKLFLNADGLLLENHNVLCYSGIDPKKIGKIFKKAREVFEYESGVLAAKIRAYEDLGFSRSVLSKLIVCSPSILIGDVNVDLVKVLEMLKSMGCDYYLVMENLSEEESYDWSSVHRVLSLLREICFDEDELYGLIKKHPRLIFEDSGEWTLILVGFETKLGLSRNELCLLFQNFPQIQVEKCVSNLKHCLLFLKEIEMEDDEILKVFHSHSCWLGSCRLKKIKTLFGKLKPNHKRLREIIKENPEEMKKWTVGSKNQPLPGGIDLVKLKTMKIQFLMYLGYKENSKEIEKAFKRFQATGFDLRERFNFLVGLGLDEKDVKDMVRKSPTILNQTIDVLETKVNYLLNELDYPLSSLVSGASCLKFSLNRMKLRFAMFYWLQARGKAAPNLAISTLVYHPEKHFVKVYVNRHSDGPKHWEDLKKQLLSD